MIVKRRHRSERQRGFALLVVVMVVALISVVALTLLDVLRIDLAIVGQNRAIAQARFVADAGNIELVDNLDTEGLLPDAITAPATLTVAVPPVTGTLINRPQTADEAAQTYQGEIRLVRFGPATNCSLSVCRDLFFEIRTVGEIGNGDASSEVRSMSKKVTTFPRGTIITNMHGR
jgi:hypothetical protein